MKPDLLFRSRAIRLSAVKDNGFTAITKTAYVGREFVSNANKGLISRVQETLFARILSHFNKIGPEFPLHKSKTRCLVRLLIVNMSQFMGHQKASSRGERKWNGTRQESWKSFVDAEKKPESSGKGKSEKKWKWKKKEKSEDWETTFQFYQEGEERR